MRAVAFLERKYPGRINPIPGASCCRKASFKKVLCEEKGRRAGNTKKRNPYCHFGFPGEQKLLQSIWLQLPDDCLKKLLHWPLAECTNDKVYLNVQVPLESALCAWHCDVRCRIEVWNTKYQINTKILNSTKTANTEKCAEDSRHQISILSGIARPPRCLMSEEWRRLKTWCFLWSTLETRCGFYLIPKWLRDSTDMRKVFI